MMGEAAHVSGRGVYQKSLPLLLSFAVLLERKSIKQSKTRYVFQAQTFLLSLRLTKALFGDRMRRGKTE